MHILIKDFQSGKEYGGLYLCKNCQTKITTTGKPYLDFTLADKSGAINGKMWSVPEEVAEAVHSGDVVAIRGKTDTYKDNLQIVVQNITVPENLEMFDRDEVESLLPMAPEPSEVYYNEMVQTAKEFKNEELKKVVLHVLEQNEAMLKKLPGGKSMHHDVIGGLAYHEGGMLRLAKGIASVYPDTKLCKELLYAGVILHDIKKIDEYTTGNSGLIDSVSPEGALLGHIVMGVEYVGRICDQLSISHEVKLCLQHMILSHHGEKEYGSPIPPKFFEAYLLHEIDMIDSRADMFDKAVRDIPVGSFSPKVYGLGDQTIYNHSLRQTTVISETSETDEQLNFSEGCEFF